MGSFYTYADLEENVNSWINMNPALTFNHSEILNELKIIINNVRKENVDLGQASFTPTIEIATGFDYIYHPLIVYHNVTNVNLVNILTSFDIEF